MCRHIEKRFVRYCKSGMVNNMHHVHEVGRGTRHIDSGQVKKQLFGSVEEANKWIRQVCD